MTPARPRCTIGPSRGASQPQEIPSWPLIEWARGLYFLPRRCLQRHPSPPLRNRTTRAGQSRSSCRLPPGGVADIVPRIVAEKLTARWGQPVIIENRPGAGHNIGAEAVAKAEPDGYTLLATPQAPLVISQFLSSKLRVRSGRVRPCHHSDIADKSSSIVNPKLPVSSLRDLIAYAKANPGKISYASPGAGSPPHLTAEMLNGAAAHPHRSTCPIRVLRPR